MAKNYNNYRLYRTLTKLSGNMKYDIVVGRNGKNLMVEGFHLTPLFKSIPYTYINDEYIVNTSNLLNIKKLYTKISSNFYNYESPFELASDNYMFLSEDRIKKIKYIKNWDDQCWAGCSRMPYKRYSTTHEILVPVWLEKVTKQLKFVLNVGFDTFSESYSLEIEKDGDNSENFHKKFSEYLFKFFSDTGLTNGNQDVLSVDLTDNLTWLSGIDVSAGKFTIKRDKSLGQNLLRRERPLLESNSLITNLFPDKNMITSQLINFNICFDIDDIIPEVIKNANQTNQEVNVWCEAYVDGELLEVRDFYTNHSYIPKSTLTAGQTSNTYVAGKQPRNALRYLNDHLCSEIMHKNKMSQSICHWCINNDHDTLFNLYDGFGSIYIDEDGKEHEYGHVSGMASPDEDTYSKEHENINWLGIPLVGQGKDVEHILDHPKKYIDTGILKDLSKPVNGYDLAYEQKEDGDPTTIYMCSMTTPKNMSYKEIETAESMIMPNKEYIGILCQRLNYYGNNDLASSRLTIPNTVSSDPGFDQSYDWFQYSDVDNRWSVYTDSSGKTYSYRQQYVDSYTGKTGSLYFGTAGTNFKLREHHNIGVLYICMRRWVDYDLEKDPEGKNAPLIIVVWHPRWTLPDSKSRDTDGVIFGDMNPDALTFGGFAKAVRGYYTNYKDVYSHMKGREPGGKFPNLDDFGLMADLFENFKYPKAFVFHKSIEGEIDDTLSTNAKEIRYWKDNKMNSYVYRYDGRITPSMSPVLYDDSNYKVGAKVNGLKYKQGMGRNFLWLKNMLPSNTNIPKYKYPEGVLKYISTKNPPRYPSLGFDSLYNNPYEDLIYTQPLDVFFGIDLKHTGLKEYSTSLQSNPDKFPWRWYEYKWFDKSQVKIMNKIITGTIEIDPTNNNKDLLDSEFIKLVQNAIVSSNGEILDEYYIRDLYDYKVSFISQHQDPETSLYKYKYSIRAELK